MANTSDILFMTEYIKNVLYFATVRQGKILKNTADFHYFCIDNDLIYENYYCDFGPLNLGCVYKYCKILSEKLKLYLNKQCIVHYTSIDPKKKANAAFLMGCYGVLYLSLPPKEAFKPLVNYGQSYRPFQDATQGEPNYTITIIDCLQGISKARDLGFFNFHDFNYEEYERLDKIQGGDLNWIVPSKFLAFIGPVDYSHVTSMYHPPEMYVDYFRENNVQIVIRLNKKLYDSDAFINAGIGHYNLFFPDGSCPSRRVLMKFLQISEDCEGAIAVHCKAGLGRTGSLIVCYLIKHYRMTAHEAIAWMRICRPGSVIGHQQGWLEDLESWLIKQGNLYRRHTFRDINKIPKHDYGIYSIFEKAAKHQCVVFSQSPSPPPKQRQNRTKGSPTSRPQASKIKEASSKTTEKERFDERWNEQMNTIRDVTKRIPSKENEARPRRGNGGGEPRNSRPSRTILSNVKGILKTAPNEVEAKNHGWHFANPTHRTGPVPNAKAFSDTKKNLLRNTPYIEPKEKKVELAVTVKPQYLFRAPNVEQKTPGDVTRIAPCNFSPVSKSPTKTIIRRRLGRSVSPPETKVIVEQTRATNTPLQENFSSRDSKAALKEALSRLKLTAPQDGSVGAASLGAQSVAHAGRRAPSACSDERAFATQGDLLNCIKFQRRLRGSPISVKKINEKNSILPKEKPAVLAVNSKTATAIKQGGLCFSLSKDKTEPPSTRGFYNPRPSSPKGRRSSHPSFS